MAIANLPSGGNEGDEEEKSEEEEGRVDVRAPP
jgi:hypothetical protein